MLRCTRPPLAKTLGGAAALAALLSVAVATAAGALGHADLQRDFASQRADADAVLAAMARPYASQLERAVAVAQAGTAAQARVLGVTLAGVPTVAHATPGQALLTLLARHGQSPSATQLSAIRKFDGLREPLRSSLTRFVEAFLAFDAATRSATEAADADELAALRRVATSADPAAAWRASAEPGAMPWRALADAGVALAPILAARNALADASVGLQSALAAPSVGPGPSVNLCPVFAVNLGTTANWYAKDCALIVDAGGNDVYRNNAGGAPSGGSLSGQLFVSLAAAVVDLAGSDRYGNPYAPRSHGANGGASFIFLPIVAGFLLDASGADQYVGSVYGVNGGGSAGGLGHLVDAGGNDKYTASGGGVNGGGHLLGAGLLVDVGGGDVFRGGTGANGGGAVGAGMLLSADGSDVYTGGGGGANGGGFLGHGLLVDRNGNDAYRAAWAGVNGGADAGVGLLLDEGGTDAYADQDRTVDGLFRCSGSGWNRTVVPKCVVGAQIDLP